MSSSKAAKPKPTTITLRAYVRIGPKNAYGIIGWDGANQHEIDQQIDEFQDSGIAYWIEIEVPAYSPEDPTPRYKFKAPTE